MLRDMVAAAFVQRFDRAPQGIVHAPGRVNLIGEHTDYNDGFVLPMAIDREIYVAFGARADRQIVVHSLEYDESAVFSLDELEHAPHSWSEYVKGVAWVLGQVDAATCGWEGVIAGNVPRGAGLSSSAALELAILRVFAAVAAAAWEPVSAAVLGQRVENEWIGVNSGIMDQMVVACARAGHALLIDCRSLQVEAVPLPDHVAIIVLDTATRRGLVASAYNERRRECEEAAAALEVPALRDVSAAMLAQHRARFAETTYRRARHVVTENERTVHAAAFMRAADLERLGNLMNESHASLRDDFEVTNTELNTMVALAQAHSACYGARMTGAGFGGCAVALVRASDAAPFVEVVSERYHASTGLTPAAYVCRAAGGASLERLAGAA